MLPHSDTFIHFFYKEDLAEPLKLVGGEYLPPVFFADRHIYSLPILEPLKLKFRLNPHGGGISANLQFKYSEEEDENDFRMAKMLTYHDDIVFVVYHNGGFVLLMDVIDHGPIVEVEQDFNVDYIPVSVTISPLLKKGTKISQKQNH